MEFTFSFLLYPLVNFFPGLITSLKKINCSQISSIKFLSISQEILDFWKDKNSFHCVQIRKHLFTMQIRCMSNRLLPALRWGSNSELPGGRFWGWGGSSPPPQSKPRSTPATYTADGVLAAGVAIVTCHSPETGSSTARIKENSPKELKRDKNSNLGTRKGIIHWWRGTLFRHVWASPPKQIQCFRKYLSNVALDQWKS